MKKIKAAYWISTILVCLMFAMNVMMYATKNPQIVNGMKFLGYPQYLITILAVAKTIAIIILLLPGFSRLKEWAYAGLTIALIGATWSHLAIGDTSTLAFIITDLILLSVSYYFLRVLQGQGSINEKLTAKRI